MKDIKIFAFADEASQNIDLQINAMKRNGLQGLEIRGVDGQSVVDISLEKAKEVKSKLDASGLITWSIGSPIGKIDITDDFAPHLDQFKHILEISNVLDAKNIRLFSFYVPDAKDATIYKTEVFERLNKFVEVAKGSGINLCHENEKGIYGENAENCLEIHKNIPEIKGIFDPANFVQAGVDTLKAWELLKDYIHYMHIKDAAADGFVVPAGFGEGNVKYIVEQYIKNGGFAFTMEPHLTVFEGLGSLEREGDKSGIGEFAYPDSVTAFNVACDTFKNLLKEIN